jgi:hypothetical protein
MKKSSFLFVAVIFVLSSCGRQEYQTGSKGFADVSLTRNSSEYSTKHLKEVEATSSSFWGIPSVVRSNGVKGKGIIVRVNGVELGGLNHGPLLPVLSLIGYTTGLGALASSVGNYGAGNIKLPLACLVALPVAGFLNEMTWRGVKIKTIQKSIDNSLLTENSNVDVFFNPRYKVEQHNGIWHSTTNVKASIMGATLK